MLKFRYNSSANDDDDDDDAAADDNDINKMWLFRSAFRVYIYTAVGKKCTQYELIIVLSASRVSYTCDRLRFALLYTVGHENVTRYYLFMNFAERTSYNRYNVNGD